MATMTKEQRAIDRLGPIGIVREALKVFCAHAEVFASIQLTLMLGLAILMLSFQYFLDPYLPQPPPPPNASYAARPLHLSRPHGGHFTMSLRGGSADWIGPLLASTAFSLGFQVAISLSLAATTYSVGLHYGGHAFSFVDVVRACTPELWMRYALTSTYANMITGAIVWAEVACISLVSLISSPPLALLISGITLVLAVVVLVAEVYLQIIFALAGSVSVLDDFYGWASVSKSRQLLKGNMFVALCVQALLLIPGFITMCLDSAVRSQLRNRGDSSASVTLAAIAVLVCVAWMTFAWQFAALCSGVQYVSFKAYHDERLAVIKKNGGLEALTDGSQSPLLGEQTGDNAA